MTAVYLALVQLGATLLARKIQQDSLDATTRQKLVDDVESQWQKVNAAHIAIQTGEANDGKNS